LNCREQIYHDNMGSGEEVWDRLQLFDSIGGYTVQYYIRLEIYQIIRVKDDGIITFQYSKQNVCNQHKSVVEISLIKTI